MPYNEIMVLNEQKQLIYATIHSIPYGSVSSYGEIAQLSGLKGYARYVASLLKTLPENSKLPWHRVVRSDGRIAFPLSSEKFQQQKQLLEDEGIVVHKGRVTSSHFAWK